jgi:hypothetical protein
MKMTVDYPEGFLEREDVVHADNFWGPLKRGAVVEVYDGSIWTVVASGFAGYGVIEGDVPEISNTQDDRLPRPTAMLREPYPSVTDRPLGEFVALVRQGKATQKPFQKPTPHRRSAP